MSPLELAAKHPRLYHVTRPEALDAINEHGLLSTSSLLTLFEVDQAQRQAIETEIRPMSVDIDHPVYGRARISDNLPLRMTPLAECLDDGLCAEQWLRIVNERVFFWVNEKDVDTHLRSGIKHGDRRIVLIFSTLSIAQMYLQRVELTAINTGTTARKVARRGLSTFSPAYLHSYRQWQALRGGHDVVRELAVVGGIRDISTHLVGYYGFPHLDEQIKRALAAIE